MPIDPISLEIQWNRLITIMDEVDIAVVRTSFSTIVGESRDFAVIMLDAQGRSLAQSQMSSPAFTCMLPVTIKHLLRQFPAETLRPGDVLITNDPWIGTGHLPDLSIFMPVFAGGRPVGFMGTAAHVSDIGGRLDYFDARDVYEEGLRIPPSKLFMAGEPNDQLLRIIEANVRVPDQVLGDVFAIVGAERIGAGRLVEFVDAYGVEHFGELAEEILRRTEMAMRQAIAQIPDGEYAYVHMADGYREPVRIQVRIVVEGDTLLADFTGSSPQFPDASINCVTNIAAADVYYSIKSSFIPEIPNNEGLFRPIRVFAPEGSVLNTTFPSPVKSRSKTSFHIHQAIYGALAQAIPDRVQAGSGSFWLVTFYGQADDGSTFAAHVIPNGGKGATATEDGLPTTAFPYNGTVTPVEILENQSPVMAVRKRFIADSGGAGRTRGGLAQEIVYRCKGGRSVIAAVRPDKLKFPAPGILGGKAGMPGHFTLNGVEVTAEPHRIRKGDELVLWLPGGAGFGDPLARDPGRVAEDVREGFVTVAAAREEYGVVIDPGTGEVDAAATSAERAARRRTTIA
ncbi:MAG: hydantoinase B/oxoprolinase family protein [Armatimonadetes bacterium]|nr:hydantoinase B/oxoprolinase family protein [Armatimonadota bacterium]